MQSVCHLLVVSATSCSSVEGLHTALPCCNMVSLPLETVLYFLTYGSLPQATVLTARLLQCGLTSVSIWTLVSANNLTVQANYSLREGIWEVILQSQIEPFYKFTVLFCFGN